ncbi:MAG: hypothetical protein ACPG31_01020 [Planctomycetota bacterium]
MTFLHYLAKGLASLLAPFLLIAVGAGIAALGIKLGWSWLMWTGLIILAAGVVWGFLLYFVFDLDLD